MGIVELVGIAAVSGAGSTTVGFAYAYRFRIRRIVRARIYGRKHDMTRNKKFVAHDRERHNNRLEAEDRWLEEWVALLGGRVSLDWYARHTFEVSTSREEKAKILREAERARIAEIIQEKRLRDRRKREILAEAAKQQRITIARLAKEQWNERMPWS